MLQMDPAVIKKNKTKKKTFSMLPSFKNTPDLTLVACLVLKSSS